jgi:hypothetical protein
VSLSAGVGWAQLRWMAGLGALTLLSTCTCPGPYDPDVAFDAPRPAPDVSSESMDSPHTADTPIALGDPGWFHVGALPTECEIEAATYPERVLAPFVWAPDCGVGCRHWGDTANMLQVDDSNGTSFAVLIGETPDGSEDPRRFTVFVDVATELAVAAYRDRGNAAITRGEPFCSIYGQGLGNGALAIQVNFFDYDVSGDRLERAWWSVLRAERSDPNATLRELHRRDVNGVTYAPRLRVSPTHVGALFGSVPILVGNDGSYVVHTFGSGDISERDHLEIFGSNDLVWEAWRGPTVLVRRVRAGRRPCFALLKARAFEGPTFVDSRATATCSPGSKAADTTTPR